MPLTLNSRNLLEPLKVAFGEDLRRFRLAERGDGSLHLIPRVDVEGIGGRIVDEGLVPAGVHCDDALWVELEQTPDPRWNCCFIGIHCRTRGGQQPLNAKLSAQWPMRYSNLLIDILRRCRRDLLASAAEARKSLRLGGGTGLVDGLRRPA